MLSGRGITKVVGLTAAGAAFAGLTFAAWTVLAVEDGIRGSYETALQERGMVGSAAVKPAPALETLPPAKGSVPVARSEDFWLGHAAKGPATPVAFVDPVSVGDTLTISLNGKEQTFRVTGVESLAEASPRGRTSARTETVEITGRLDGDARTSLRVQIEVDLSNPKMARAGERAL